MNCRKGMLSVVGSKRAGWPHPRVPGMLDERTRYNLWVGGSGTNYPVYHKNSVTVLDVFGLGFHWYAGSGWQGRSKKLFEAAGGVAIVLR